MKKHSLKTKLIVLVLAVLMVLTLTACSETTKSFMKDGWDYESNGYTYAKEGFGPGKNSEGEDSFYTYSLKGQDAYGGIVDVSGDKVATWPSYPATSLPDY